MQKRILRRCAAVILLAVLFVSSVRADGGQEGREDSRIRFAYDLDFEMKFDNREFDPGRFSSSMTIFGVRLTPEVGLEVAQRNGYRHRLMAGVDVMKDFGASCRLKDFFQELVLYYSFGMKLGKTDFSLHAGIFPKRVSDGRYDKAFCSDSLRFYDTNFEGLLLQFRRPKSYYELGADWLGKIGADSRERFVVFSSGRSEVVKSLTLAYSGYMYHYACSGVASGVVDNILLHPSLTFDAAAFLPLQRFSLTVGWLQAFQQDRKFVGKYVFPGGGKLDLELRNWNFGVKNSLYYGKDLMPYYNMRDESGAKYGSSLYFGDPFYRVRTDGSGSPAFYDCLEVYYRPQIGRYLQIDVSAIFHFNGGGGFRQGYSGCQQIVGFRFNLHELLKRKK